MISLPQPPSINIQNPLSGISDKANNLISSTSTNVLNKLPDKRVSGLKFEKPDIDCAKYSLNSLKTLPGLPSISIPKLGLPIPPIPPIPSFTLPSIPNLSIPNLPALPKIPNLPSISNLPSFTLPSIPQVSIPKLPTLDSINPLPIDLKVKAWLAEPPKLTSLIKKLLPANLPNLPKPPFFSIKCSK